MAIGFWFKYYILPESYFVGCFTVLEDISLSVHLPNWLSASIVTLLTRLGLKDLLENIEFPTKEVMPIGGNDLESPVTASPCKNYLTADNPNPGGSGPEVESEAEMKSKIARAIVDIGAKTTTYVEVNDILVDKLSRLKNNVDNINPEYLKTPQGLEIIKSILDIHLGSVIEYNHNRCVYIISVSPYLDEESQLILEGMQGKLMAIRLEFINKVEILQKTKQGEPLIREMFTVTNIFRKDSAKYLNIGENYFHAQFRASSIFKDLDLKRTINSNWAGAKKSFSDEDSYLRKKISEVINAKKA